MIKDKIIHQVWLGPNPAPEKWMQTWKDKHPAWTFMLWGNGLLKDYPFKNRNLINECMDKKLYAGASDIIGYQILYDFGGFLAKTDTECLNPIDELMDIKEDCFTSYVSEKFGSVSGHKLLSLHLASKKGCPLMLEVIKELEERKKPIKVPWHSTGNLLFTKIVEKTEYPIKIYPSHFFSPTYYNGVRYQGKDKIYSEHYWGTTKRLY